VSVRGGARSRSDNLPQKGGGRAGGTPDRVGVDRRFDRTPAKTARARRLRHEMTDMERKLWGHLRADQMEGIGFRRQHPVGRYVLDFYCPHLKLAIEVDGGQHGEDPVAVRDNERTAFLAARGIVVLRFWNIDVMENLDGLLEMIRGSVIARGRDRAGAASTPTPTLPLSGGGSDRKADR